MLDRFRQFGLSDVHEQFFDLPPQWMPQSWSVTASGNGKTMSVDTAQPTYQAIGTPPEVFEKTALLVNSEHTGGMETGAGTIRLANAVASFNWYGTGPQLAEIVARAMVAFRGPRYPNPRPRPQGKFAATYANG